MYELIEIVEGDATRFLRLKNMDTGVVEVCFDDSAVVSNINFNFMEIGQEYECKIKLFGKPVYEKTDGCVTCKIIDGKTRIGQKQMVEVEVDNNKYYIPRVKVKDYLEYGSFNFCFSRKDLIQVSSIVHADLL